jgi:hypothetical protein
MYFEDRKIDELFEMLFYSRNNNNTPKKIYIKEICQKLADANTSTDVPKELIDIDNIMNEELYVKQNGNTDKNFISFITVCNEILDNDKLPLDIKYIKINSLFSEFSKSTDTDTDTQNNFKKFLVNLRFICCHNHNILRDELFKTLIILYKLISGCDQELIITTTGVGPVTRRFFMNTAKKSSEISSEMIQSMRKIASIIQPTTNATSDEIVTNPMVATQDEIKHVEVIYEKDDNDTINKSKTKYGLLPIRYEEKYKAVKLPIISGLYDFDKKYQFIINGTSVTPEMVKHVTDHFLLHANSNTSFDTGNPSKTDRIYKLIIDKLEDDYLLRPEISEINILQGISLKTPEKQKEILIKKKEEELNTKIRDTIYSLLKKQLFEYINCIKNNFIMFENLYESGFISAVDYDDQSQYDNSQMIDAIEHTLLIKSIDNSVKSQMDFFRMTSINDASKWAVSGGSDTLYLGHMLKAMGVWFTPFTYGVSLVAGFIGSKIIDYAMSKINKISFVQNWNDDQIFMGKYTEVNTNFGESIERLNKHLYKHKMVIVGEPESCSIKDNKRYKLFTTADKFQREYFDKTLKYYDTPINKFNNFMNIYFLLYENIEEIKERQQQREKAEREAAAAAEREKAEREAMGEQEHIGRLAERAAAERAVAEREAAARAAAEQAERAAAPEQADREAAREQEERASADLEHINKLFAAQQSVLEALGDRETIRHLCEKLKGCNVGRVLDTSKKRLFSYDNNNNSYNVTFAIDKINNILLYYELHDKGQLRNMINILYLVEDCEPKNINNFFEILINPFVDKRTNEIIDKPYAVKLEQEREQESITLENAHGRTRNNAVYKSRGGNKTRRHHKLINKKTHHRFIRKLNTHRYRKMNNITRRHS